MTGTLGAPLSAGLAGKSRCGEPVAGMGRRDSASACGIRAPLRRFAPCVLRWKTLRVSSAPHPCGLEFLRLPTRKRPGLLWA